MRHVGLGTINKQTGNTFDGRCAIEMSKSCSPWGEDQIVVMLSRTHTACDTIIVGNKEFALNRMWDLITVGTQWTRYIEKLLERMSVGGTAPSTGGDVLDISEVYPYRISDISLPDDNSSFVHFLVLVMDCGRTYVGQTKNISRRLKEDNKGWGAMGTAEPQYRPYTVAAYICRMPHIDKRGRVCLKQRWKKFILESKSRGKIDVFTWVLLGERVVESYNAYQVDEEKHIRLVITISKSLL